MKSETARNFVVSGLRVGMRAGNFGFIHLYSGCAGASGDVPLWRRPARALAAVHSGI
jgi:hypothetical protein